MSIDALVVDFDPHFSGLMRELLTAADASLVTRIAEDLTLGVINSVNPTCIVLCATTMQSPLLVMSPRIAAARLPLLGICNGAQLIAEAAGGSLGVLPQPEDGLVAYRRRPPPRRSDPLARSIDRRSGRVFMHHTMVVKSLPPMSSVLGSTSLTHYAAFSIPAGPVGGPAIGLQYHPEVPIAQSTNRYPKLFRRFFSTLRHSYRRREPISRCGDDIPLFTARPQQLINRVNGPG